MNLIIERRQVGEYQLDVVSYLFWYDPFYHGNFKFKA